DGHTNEISKPVSEQGDDEYGREIGTKRLFRLLIGAHENQGHLKSRIRKQSRGGSLHRLLPIRLKQGKQVFHFPGLEQGRDQQEQKFVEPRQHIDPAVADIGGGGHQHQHDHHDRRPLKDGGHQHLSEGPGHHHHASQPVHEKNGEKNNAQNFPKPGIPPDSEDFLDDGGKAHPRKKTAQFADHKEHDSGYDPHQRDHQNPVRAHFLGHRAGKEQHADTDDA